MIYICSEILCNILNHQLRLILKCKSLVHFNLNNKFAEEQKILEKFTQEAMIFCIYLLLSNGFIE